MDLNKYVHALCTRYDNTTSSIKTLGFIRHRVGSDVSAQLELLLVNYN